MAGQATRGRGLRVTARRGAGSRARRSPPRRGARPSRRGTAPRRRRSGARPGRSSSSWPGSISPWKMWPPVRPKRASSSRGPEREAVDDPVGELGADLGEAGDGGVGGGVGVDVGREALAEQREHVAPGRRERRVGGGLARGLDPRPLRPGGRRARRRAAAARSSSVKPMSIVAVPGLLARARLGKSGSPSSRTMTLTTGPAWRQPGGASTPASARGARAGRRWRAPRGADAPRRPASTTPAARPSVDQDLLDRRRRCAPRAPAASAAERSAPVTAPMPPRA